MDVLYSSNNVELYKVLVKELAHTLERQISGNAESRAAGMVINTMGWIEGVGYEASDLRWLKAICAGLSHILVLIFFLPFLQLLQHAIDRFKVNVVLVLGQVDNYLSSILIYFSSVCEFLWTSYI